MSASPLVAEAMEVMGGNGYVERSVMARLLREAPVNSIWEGSGNIMCLDVLRALARDPEGAACLLHDLQQHCEGVPVLQSTLQALAAALRQPAAQLEAQARHWVQQLVLVAQAGLLLRHAPQAVAHAFVRSRLGSSSCGWVVGALDVQGGDVEAILQRALPQ